MAQAKIYQFSYCKLTVWVAITASPYPTSNVHQALRGMTALPVQQENFAIVKLQHVKIVLADIFRGQKQPFVQFVHVDIFLQVVPVYVWVVLMELMHKLMDLQVVYFVLQDISLDLTQAFVQLVTQGPILKLEQIVHFVQVVLYQVHLVPHVALNVRRELMQIVKD